MALRDKIAKYDALVSDMRLSSFGYWVVKFSVAPGVDMSVMLCNAGLAQDEALERAAQTLSIQTGQKVRG